MLAIVDYKAGNLTSVKLALDTIGVAGTITSDPHIISSADCIIFPGVGAAGAAMVNLHRLGLVEVLREKALNRRTPILGICVGLQVLFDYSEENGGTETLGIIPGSVHKFRPSHNGDKVPQIGWNAITWEENKQPDSCLRKIPNSSDFYFVHSYYAIPQNPECVLATTEYAGTTFASMLRFDNVIAVQFHPEKSGKIGLKLLANFCIGG